MSTTPCEPCDRLPKRLSCCDCINLIKVGCLPVCGLTGIMIPMPHLHICGRFQGTLRGSADLCRRCCGGEDGCGDTSSSSDPSCCTVSGAQVKNCKRPGDPPEKDDIWCHMRCSTPLNSSQICRRCCEDGDCGPTTSDCKCCQTIQQRMNF